MLKSDVDLNRMKAEMLEYLGTGGVPIFYCFGVPGEEGYVYWDNRQHPDWRQFIDVAREAGAKLFLFASHELETEELSGARDTLSDVGDLADVSQGSCRCPARRSFARAHHCHLGHLQRAHVPADI